MDTWRFRPPPPAPHAPASTAGSSRTQTTQPRVERLFDSVRISRGGRAPRRRSFVTCAAFGFRDDGGDPTGAPLQLDADRARRLGEPHPGEPLPRGSEEKDGPAFRTTHDLLHGARAARASSSSSRAMCVASTTPPPRRRRRSLCCVRRETRGTPSSVRETTTLRRCLAAGGSDRCARDDALALASRVGRDTAPRWSSRVSGDRAVVSVPCGRGWWWRERCRRRRVGAARASSHPSAPRTRCKEAVNAGDCFAASSRPPTAVRGPTNGGGGGGASTRRVRGGARASCTIA